MKALIAVLAALAPFAACQGWIITVPADFRTIQAAIDDATDGDTVEIRAGTYTGTGNRDIDFKGKAITVRSTDPNDWAVVAATIIDSQGSEADPHRGFKFHSGEDASSVLAGLTITNGYGPIDIVFGSITTSAGGGIYCSASSPTISKCIIADNQASNGGGICCCEGAAPRIRNCSIRNNSGDGGGVYCVNSSVEITNCVISNNVAPTSGNIYGEGGGILCEYSSPTIKNCTFYGNYATGEAGAIYTSNSPESISNCIIWGNWPYEIRGTATVTYSNVRGGYSRVGNINVDPRFADPEAGDFHLKSQAGRWDPVSKTWVQDSVTSPCIDTGDPMTPIGYEPFPNGGIVNMGAYGGTPEASKSYFGAAPCETIVAGDLNGDCKVSYLDFQIMALHWMEEH